MKDYDKPGAGELKTVGVLDCMDKQIRQTISIKTRIQVVCRSPTFRTVSQDATYSLKRKTYLRFLFTICRLSCRLFDKCEI